MPHRRAGRTPRRRHRPVVSGSIQIVDGRFVFNRFPYPLRNVSGRIDFTGPRASDEGRGAGRLSLNLRGNGIPTGPNRDTVLQIKTFGDGIGPIGTNICGVNVRISGENVAAEDALRAAFPPDVRQALTTLDAHRTGKYPQFGGDFVTEVVRPVGANKRWSVRHRHHAQERQRCAGGVPLPAARHDRQAADPLRLHRAG